MRPHRRLHGRLAAPLLLLALGCASDEVEAVHGARGLVLIAIDGLRADLLSCYGDPRGLTPNIDGLAGRGTRFERFYTPGDRADVAFGELAGDWWYSQPQLDLDAGVSLDRDASWLERERLLVRLRARSEPHGECSAGDDPGACAARIADVDARIGELLALLDERGRLATTHVVVTATHGSVRPADGYGLTDRALRVPLVVAGPGVHTGAVVSHPVGWSDLLPTVAHLLDRPHPRGSSGTSLVPWLAGDGDPPRDVWLRNTRTEREFGLPPLEAVVWEHWKYVRVADGGEALYDLAVDPLEASDLAGDEPVRLVQGRQRLQRLVESDAYPRFASWVWSDRREAYAARAEAGLPPLREGRPAFNTFLEPPGPEPVDPHSLAATVDGFLRARDLLEAGDVAQARPHVEAVERAAPWSAVAALLRGLELELDDGSLDEALQHYRVASARDSSLVSAWLGRARIHRRQGELARWLWNARVATELGASRTEMLDARAAIRARARELRGSGRTAEATELLGVLGMDRQIQRMRDPMEELLIMGGGLSSL